MCVNFFTTSHCLWSSHPWQQLIAVMSPNHILNPSPLHPIPGHVWRLCRRQPARMRSSSYIPEYSICCMTMCSAHTNQTIHIHIYWKSSSTPMTSNMDDSIDHVWIFDKITPIMQSSLWITLLTPNRHFIHQIWRMPSVYHTTVSPL